MCCSTTLPSFRHKKCIINLKSWDYCVHKVKRLLSVCTNTFTVQDLGGRGEWIPCNYVSNGYDRLYFIFIFFTYSQPGPIFFKYLFVQYSQIYLPPLRPLSGEAPGRDLNPGRASPVAGTLTTRQGWASVLFKRTQRSYVLFRSL